MVHVLSNLYINNSELFVHIVLLLAISFYEGEEPPGEGDATSDQRNLPDFLPSRTHLLADQ